MFGTLYFLVACLSRKLFNVLDISSKQALLVHLEVKSHAIRFVRY